MLLGSGSGDRVKEQQMTGNFLSCCLFEINQHDKQEYVK